MIVTDRDILIMYHISNFGLSIAQTIGTLFFNGKNVSGVAKHRLRFLESEGYVVSSGVPYDRFKMYRVTPQAEEILKERFNKAVPRSTEFPWYKIDHEVQIQKTIQNLHIFGFRKFESEKIIRIKKNRNDLLPDFSCQDDFGHTFYFEIENEEKLKSDLRDRFARFAVEDRPDCLVYLVKRKRFITKIEEIVTNHDLDLNVYAFHYDDFINNPRMFLTGLESKLQEEVYEK